VGRVAALPGQTGAMLAHGAFILFLVMQRMAESVAINREQFDASIDSAESHSTHWRPHWRQWEKHWEAQNNEELPQLNLGSLQETIQRAHKTVQNISLADALEHLGGLGSRRASERDTVQPFFHAADCQGAATVCNRP